MSIRYIDWVMKKNLLNIPWFHNLPGLVKPVLLDVKRERFPDLANSYPKKCMPIAADIRIAALPLGVTLHVINSLKPFIVMFEFSIFF